MKISKILSVGIMLTSAISVFGWGQKGHDVTAYIAECHLTPAARAAVDSLLDGKSLVYWANWLDNASHTPDYEYSITWHYKNVDADKNFDTMPKLETGDIVTALNEQQRVLADTTLSKEQRALALKMVTHLYGDLHQPMHLGHKSDRGGNYWDVRFFKGHSNIHTVWDSKLPEAAHKWSYSEWQQQLDRATTEETATILLPGNPENYARETYEICKQVYDATPRDTNIEYTYIADWTPVVEQQFLRGGLRLADTLNAIFDPQYVRPQ